MWSQCGLIPHYPKVRFFRTTFFFKTLFFLFYLNVYFIIYLNFFKCKNNKSNNIRLCFQKNDFFFKNTSVVKKNIIIFSDKILKNIMLVLSNLFSMGVNFLVLDKNYNYNYLPIGDSYLNKKKTYKIIKFFKIKAFLFLDMKPRKIKNFLDFNLLNISINYSVAGVSIDFLSKIKNIKIFHYMVYVFMLSIYLSK